MEVDEYQFHQQNDKQLERDRLKDGILKKVGLSVLRLATNSSGEKRVLEEMLLEIVRDSASNNSDDDQPDTLEDIDSAG